jgi:hypothetical protein
MFLQKFAKRISEIISGSLDKENHCFKPFELALCLDLFHFVSISGSFGPGQQVSRVLTWLECRQRTHLCCEGGGSGEIRREVCSVISVISVQMNLREKHGKAISLLKDLMRYWRCRLVIFSHTGSQSPDTLVDTKLALSNTIEQ